MTSLGCSVCGRLLLQRFMVATTPGRLAGQCFICSVPHDDDVTTTCCLCMQTYHNSCMVQCMESMEQQALRRRLEFELPDLFNSWRAALFSQTFCQQHAIINNMSNHKRATDATLPGILCALYVAARSLILYSASCLCLRLLPIQYKHFLPLMISSACQFVGVVAFTGRPIVW